MDLNCLGLLVQSQTTFIAFYSREHPQARLNRCRPQLLYAVVPTFAGQSVSIIHNLMFSFDKFCNFYNRTNSLPYIEFVFFTFVTYEMMIYHPSHINLVYVIFLIYKMMIFCPSQMKNIYFHPSYSYWKKNHVHLMPHKF